MTGKSGGPTKPANTGAKLDAEKLGEYVVEVEADWDTSHWSRWTVTGRILPERCNVSFPPVSSRGVGAGGRFQLILEAKHSHLIARLLTETKDVSYHEVVDVVRSTASFPVNYIAFMNRGAYEVVVDLCINESTGENATLPIFEPIFDVQDPGLCFKAGLETFPIPYAAGNYQLATALQDLTQATRQPRRTFENCRMAVEVIRNFFDPPENKNERERHIEGEKRLCHALRVERRSLIKLDAMAARSRHGDMVFSMGWPLRKRALEFAWEVAARFAHHVEHQNPGKDWKRLDVDFEVYNETARPVT